MDFSKLINNNGMYLYEDDSFNTITMKLNFLAGSSNRDSAILDILCCYLEQTNKNYKTDDDINERKQELYSLDLSFNNTVLSSQKLFNMYVNFISPNVIGDNYLDDAFCFIRQMLKEVDFTNEEMLAVVKKNLISYIKSSLLDNETYAANMYFQKVLPDDSREYDCSTDIDYITDLINSITLEDLKKEYEFIMNNFINGLVFGNINESQFNNLVSSLGLNPTKKDIDYNKNIPVANEDIEIEKDSEQSYIYVTYDINNLTYPQLLLLKMIMNSSLGLCYQTLREKYGLVYSAYAAFMYYLKKVYIYAETSKDKKEKFLEALDEIIKVLNDKELLDKLIVTAKAEIESREVTLSEDKNRIINSINDYILKLYDGQNRNEVYEEVMKINADELIESTKTLRRKNVFMVRSNRNEQV